MRRGLMSCVIIAIALIVQLTIVSRLAFPGGTGPDLVLLAVVALALTGGPASGAVIGFFAGLALDVAPPASHVIGQYALVFCLVGYGCGRVAAYTEGSAGLYAVIAAVGAAIGAALRAALGVLLSSPEVTWQAVRHVLPSSVVYDVILSPFVLYAVVYAVRWVTGGTPWTQRAGQEGALAAGAAALAGSAGPARRGWLAGASGAFDFSGTVSWNPPGRPVSSGSVRTTGVGSPPKLKLAGRRSADGWIGGGQAAFSGPGGRQAPGVRGGRSEPKLRLGGQRTALNATGHANGSGPVGSRTLPQVRFGNGRRGDGVLGGRQAQGTQRFRGGRSEPKLRLGGQRTALNATGHANGSGPVGSRTLPQVRFGNGRRGDGVLGGRAGSGSRSLSAAVPRVRFGNGRRGDGVLGGGARGSLTAGRVAGRSPAVPRFRRQRGTGTLGTGGAMNGSGLRNGGTFRGTAPRLKLGESKTWRLLGKRTGGDR